MNKKLLTTLTMAVGITVASNSFASGASPYVSIKAGAGLAISNDTYREIDFDVKPYGITYSGAVGMEYYLTKNYDIRTELEIGNSYYRDKAQIIVEDVLHYTTKLTQKVTTGFVNAYFDFMKDNKIKPYVGAGVGYASIKGITEMSYYYGSYDDAASISYRANRIAYQASAGFGFDITDSLSGDFGLRYMYVQNLPCFMNYNITDGNLETITGTIGLKYKF